jgi:hypothetical protein
MFEHLIVAGLNGATNLRIQGKQEYLKMKPAQRSSKIKWENAKK